MAYEVLRKCLLKTAHIDVLAEASMGSSSRSLPSGGWAAVRRMVVRIGRPNEPEARAVPAVCGGTKPCEHGLA